MLLVPTERDPIERVRVAAYRPYDLRARLEITATLSLVTVGAAVGGLRSHYCDCSSSWEIKTRRRPWTRPASDSQVKQL